MITRRLRRAAPKPRPKPKPKPVKKAFDPTRTNVGPVSKPKRKPWSEQLQPRARMVVGGGKSFKPKPAAKPKPKVKTRIRKAPTRRRRA